MINLKKTMGIALITLAIGATSVAAIAGPMNKTSSDPFKANFRQTSSGISTVEGEIPTDRDGMIYDNNRDQRNCHGGSESEMHNGMNYNSTSRNKMHNNNNNLDNGFKGLSL